jgi:hypothetical protein
MTAELDLDRPEVLAEVAEQVRDYERALVANDVTALEGFFWDSPLALRFGVGEELHGAEAISTFRRTRVVNFSDRRSVRESLHTFGSDLAVATLEFSVIVAQNTRHGRQTQLWIRLPGKGWRIVSAHVSHRQVFAGAPAGDRPAAAYAQAAAALVPLPIPAAFAEGVATNLALMAKIAGPLLAFELPDIEPAPRFHP